MRLLFLSTLAGFADAVSNVTFFGTPRLSLDQTLPNRDERGKVLAQVANVAIDKPNCVGGSSANARSIGYYQAWNIRTRPCDKVWPSQLNLDGVSHLNLAFASIHPKTFQIRLQNPSDDTAYRQLIAYKEKGLQIWLGVGGWEYSDEGEKRTTWSDMASSPENREAFITSTVNLIKDYGFQGLDIDWEWPASGNRGGRPEDTQNQVALIKELRLALGNDLGLSVVLPVDNSYLQGIDIKSLSEHVDWFNILTYDLHGAWDAQNPAFGSKILPHNDIQEIDTHLEALWATGVSPNKFTLGLAYYGRGYTVTDNKCAHSGCAFDGPSQKGACTNQAGILSGCEIKRLIIEKDLKPQLITDGAGAMQLAWDDQWIAYDNRVTFGMKRSFANERCMGGTSVWALDYDSCDQQGHLPPPSGPDQSSTLSAAPVPTSIPSPASLSRSVSFPSEVSSSLAQTSIWQNPPVVSGIPSGTSRSPIVSEIPPAMSASSAVASTTHAPSLLVPSQPSSRLVSLSSGLPSSPVQPPTSPDPPAVSDITSDSSRLTITSELPPAMSGTSLVASKTSAPSVIKPSQPSSLLASLPSGLPPSQIQPSISQDPSSTSEVSIDSSSKSVISSVDQSPFPIVTPGAPSSFIEGTSVIPSSVSGSQEPSSSLNFAPWPQESSSSSRNAHSSSASSIVQEPTWPAIPSDPTTSPQIPSISLPPGVPSEIQTTSSLPSTENSWTPRTSNPVSASASHSSSSPPLIPTPSGDPSEAPTTTSLPTTENPRSPETSIVGSLIAPHSQSIAPTSKTEWSVPTKSISSQIRASTSTSATIVSSIVVIVPSISGELTSTIMSASGSSSFRSSALGTTKSVSTPSLVVSTELSIRTITSVELESTVITVVTLTPSTSLEQSPLPELSSSASTTVLIPITFPTPSGRTDTEGLSIPWNSQASLSSHTPGSLPSQTSRSSQDPLLSGSSQGSQAPLSSRSQPPQTSVSPQVSRPPLISGPSQAPSQISWPFETPPQTSWTSRDPLPSQTSQPSQNPLSSQPSWVPQPSPPSLSWHSERPSDPHISLHSKLPPNTPVSLTSGDPSDLPISWRPQLPTDPQIPWTSERPWESPIPWTSGRPSESPRPLPPGLPSRSNPSLPSQSSDAIIRPTPAPIVTPGAPSESSISWHPELPSDSVPWPSEFPWTPGGSGTSVPPTPLPIVTPDPSDSISWKSALPTGSRPPWTSRKPSSTDDKPGPPGGTHYPHDPWSIGDDYCPEDSDRVKYSKTNKRGFFGCGCGWSGLAFGPPCPPPRCIGPPWFCLVVWLIEHVHPCGKMFECNPCKWFGCPGVKGSCGILGCEGFCDSIWGCDLNCPKEICGTCTLPGTCGPLPGPPPNRGHGEPEPTNGISPSITPTFTPRPLCEDADKVTVTEVLSVCMDYPTAIGNSNITTTTEECTGVFTNTMVGCPPMAGHTSKTYITQESSCTQSSTVLQTYVSCLEGPHSTVAFATTRTCTSSFKTLIGCDVTGTATTTVSSTAAACSLAALESLEDEGDNLGLSINATTRNIAIPTLYMQNATHNSCPRGGIDLDFDEGDNAGRLPAPIPIPTLYMQNSTHASCTLGAIDLDAEEGDNSGRFRLPIPVPTLLMQNATSTTTITIPTLLMPNETYHGACGLGGFDLDFEEGNNEGRFKTPISIPTIWMAESSTSESSPAPRSSAPTLVHQPTSKNVAAPTLPHESTSESTTSTSEPEAEPTKVNKPIQAGGAWIIDARLAMRNGGNWYFSWWLIDSNGNDAGHGDQDTPIQTQFRPPKDRMPFDIEFEVKRIKDKWRPVVLFKVMMDLPSGKQLTFDTEGHSSDIPEDGYPNSASGCHDVLENQYTWQGKCNFNWLGAGGYIEGTDQAVPLGPLAG